MKILAVNGSPRKGWNTYTLLKCALEGAQSAGAETELINLYDIEFKGCVSCFSCKLKGVLPGNCALRDGLTPILDAASGCGAVIFGSPVYLDDVTGEMRSFIERLCFPLVSYEKDGGMPFARIPTAFIYTMNAMERELTKVGYTQLFARNEELLTRIFGSCETLASTQTWQFDDYSKYAASRFDAGERKTRRETVFPGECEKAREMGRRLAEKILLSQSI